MVTYKRYDRGRIPTGLDLGILEDELTPAIQDKGPTGAGLAAIECELLTIDCALYGTALTLGYAKTPGDKAVDIREQRKIEVMGLPEDL